MLIFEGALDESGLAQLRRLLDNEELTMLRDADIASPLMVDSVDWLQLNVFRGDHWQELHFRDASSRKAFHTTIDPLISWLDAIPRFPHRELSEDAGRNNCLPPKKIELKRRAGMEPESNSTAAGGQTKSEVPGGTALMAPSGPRSFLLQMTTDNVEGGMVHRTCVVVFANGDSHREEATQQHGGSVKTKVYERTARGAEVAELRQILSSPELKGSQHNAQPENIPVRELELVRVSIPRGTGVQKLSFFSYFGALSQYRNVPNATDHEIANLKPVQQWISAHAPTKSEFLQKDAKPTQCQPK